MSDRILYIDPIGGLAGDMLCAALIDAGLNEVQWRETLEQLSWNENARITSKSVMRGVFAATHIDIRPSASQENHPPTPAPSGPNHHHAHGHHSHTHVHSQAHDSGGRISGPTPVPWSKHHRGFTDVSELIVASPLPDVVKKNAIRVFQILGEAEAEIHGTSLDDVHFHEVGAVDSILDIVGFCLGVHLLGITKVYAGSIPLSTGTVHTAHGKTPLPAPALRDLSYHLSHVSSHCFVLMKHKTCR